MNETLQRVCKTLEESESFTLVPNKLYDYFWLTNRKTEATIPAFENKFTNVRDFLLWFIIDNRSDCKYMSQTPSGQNCGPRALRSISELYKITKNYFDITAEQFFKEILLLQKEEVLVIYTCNTIKKICVVEKKIQSSVVPNGYAGLTNVIDSELQYTMDDILSINM